MRVLVVGLGSIGQRHVRNLRGLLGPSVEILTCRTRGRPAVIDDGLASADGRVETAYGIETYHDLRHALERRPDAVLVCNPTSLHLATALAAADAGCHLFIEKPLSHSLDGVEELAAAVESRRLIALVGYQLRFHPCLVRLRSVLESGMLGRLISVRAEISEYLPDWHPYEDYRQMYAARADQGGGVVLSQIHELDYLVWLFGVPRRVFALGGHLSTLEIDVEDTASILMECRVDDRCLPVHLHQDFVRRPPSRICEVRGDAGTARLDFRAFTLDVMDTAGGVVESYHPKDAVRNQLFVDEMHHFLACLAGEATPIVGVREAMQRLTIALAAKESMATGLAVEVRG